MADDPTDPPRLSGWQYVTLEVVKLLVPVALAVVAIWQANKAGDQARVAVGKAGEATAAVEKHLRYTGTPKE